MKRILARLAVVSVLGGIGYYAVAQAKHDTTPQADAKETARSAAIESPSTAARPSTPKQPTADPMAIAVRATESLESTVRPQRPPRELPTSERLADTNPLRRAPVRSSPIGDRYAAMPASASEPVPAASERPDPFGLVADPGSSANSEPHVSPQFERPSGPSPDRLESQTPASGSRYATTHDSNLPSADRRAVAPADPMPTADRFSTSPSIQDRSGPPRELPSAIPDQPASAFPDAEPLRRVTPQLANNFPEASVGRTGPQTAPSTARATGRPGNTRLEGPQSPNLTIEKSAPEEIQVGKATKFQVIVRNTGATAAHGVRVQDQVPRGTRLLSTKPDATTDRDGTLVWDLGTLEADDERILEMELMPEAEGEIGSVASVTFRAEVSVRTIATRPELRVVVSGPPKVLAGDNLTLTIQVTNAGTGAADEVVLYNNLPPQLQHESGSELEFEIGRLAPKETRSITLQLTAAQAGRVETAISARGEGSVAAVGDLRMEVIAAELSITIDGPRRRYLERAATYTLSVANKGTASAKDIELVSHLPKGMKFVSANNAGHYDAKSHAIYWSLSELPEGESGRVKLVAMPIEAGQHTLRVEGKADRNLHDSREATVLVEGVAALLFEVVDVEDPVEVGGDTMYEIRVLNQGTKTASNLRIVATLPQQLKPLSADGPTRHVIDGNRVIFEALPRLAPKADTTFKVRAQGMEPGDLRIRVQMQSDDMESPVTKEESTRVYSDR